MNKLRFTENFIIYFREFSVCPIANKGILSPAIVHILESLAIPL